MGLMSEIYSLSLFQSQHWYKILFCCIHSPPAKCKCIFCAQSRNRFCATFPPENFIPPPAQQICFCKISFYDQTWLRPLVRLYGLWWQDLVKSQLEKSLVPKVWRKLIGWRIRVEVFCIWWFLLLGPQSATLLSIAAVPGWIGLRTCCQLNQIKRDHPMYVRCKQALTFNLLFLNQAATAMAPQIYWPL